ncbi:MAG: hypothetical protein ACRYGR_09950 [Janthinobacterium lividum]
MDIAGRDGTPGCGSRGPIAAVHDCRHGRVESREGYAGCACADGCGVGDCGGAGIRAGDSAWDGVGGCFVRGAGA